MTDNIVLDALEGAKVKFSEINEPAYTGENCEFYEELLGKAIPIYKAEQAVVEAARYYFSNDHEQEWATRRMLEALQRLDKVRGTTPDS